MHPVKALISIPRNLEIIGFIVVFMRKVTPAFFKVYLVNPGIKTEKSE